MNCAPIAITGGSDDGKAYYESLPDMLVANVPATDCTTAESTDADPPNPGSFVLQDSAYKSGKVTGPKCGTVAPAQNQNSAAGKVTNLAAFSKPAKDSNVIVPVNGGSSGGSGSGSGSGNGGAASSASGGNDGMYTQSAASPAQPSSTPTAGGNDGIYSQPAASSAQPTSTAASSPASSPASSAPPSSTALASSASSTAPSSIFSTHTVPASSATSPAYPTPSPTIGQGVSGTSTGIATPVGSPSYSSGSSSSGSAGSSGQCTTDGAIVCNGSTQFGVCDHGSVVWQVVAAGTTCSNGAILKRSQPFLPRHHARGFHKNRVL